MSSSALLSLAEGELLMDHFREIVDGSGAFFGPFGKRDKRGDELLKEWEGEKLEEKLWEASERMVREKGFEI